MAPSRRTLSSYNKANILLASFTINNQQLESSRHATLVYNVPKSILNDRRAGKLAQSDYQPNSKKLTQLEEKVIVDYILDLYLREFAPRYAAIRDMADQLLAARGVG